MPTYNGNKNNSIALHNTVQDTPITPITGYSKIYAKDDNNWYYLDDTGVEHAFATSEDTNQPPAVVTFAQAATGAKLLFNPVYDNGPLNDGVGATLTASLPGIVSDGTSSGKIDFTYTPVNGGIILVWYENASTNPSLNKQFTHGIYEITDKGSPSTNYVLTRLAGFDESSELFPLQVNITDGLNYLGKYFIQKTPSPDIGTDKLIFILSGNQIQTPQIAFVDTATTTALPPCTYVPGTTLTSLPGSGATLTADSPGVLGSIGGLTAETNANIVTGFTRVLVKDQTGPLAYQNGDYQVIDKGSPSTPWKLRRIQNWAGAFSRYTKFFIVSNTGSTQAGKLYFTTPNSPPLTNATIGTANLQILEYGGNLTVGENYVVVYAGEDWVANGIELRNALTTAEALSPNGASISATNRVTIICYPGYYDVANNLNFRETVNDYIDLVSITGNCDVNLVEISGTPTGQPIIVNSIDNNFVGINCGTGAFVIDSSSSIANNQVNCLNCKGGDNSFGSGRLSSVSFDLYGNFENCNGGNESFGGGSSGSTPLNTYGKYINCIGKDYSFGTNGNINGAIYENCIAGRGSFGYLCLALNDVKFINCTSDITSFGYSCNDIINTYFENCKGGSACFGSYFGITSGTPQSATFINCESENLSFGVEFNGDLQFTFTNCIGKDSCFGYKAVATGANQIINCYNCISNNSSFQYSAPSNYYNCTGNDYCFQDDREISSGLYVNCKAHGYSFGAVSGTASGLYKYCIAGESCFASGIGTGTLSGKLYYCQMDYTTFNTVSGAGRTFYCVGNDTPNNQ
jgi:hypothetical protein